MVWLARTMTKRDKYLLPPPSPSFTPLLTHPHPNNLTVRATQPCKHNSYVCAYRAIKQTYRLHYPSSIQFSLLSSPLLSLAVLTFSFHNILFVYILNGSVCVPGWQKLNGIFTVVHIFYQWGIFILIAAICVFHKIWKRKTPW